MAFFSVLRSPATQVLLFHWLAISAEIARFGDGVHRNIGRGFQRFADIVEKTVMALRAFGIRCGFGGRSGLALLGSF
jgi:hypothetical protein